MQCPYHINLTVQAFLFGKQARDYKLTKDAEEGQSDEELTQLAQAGHNITTRIMGSTKRIQES